MVPVRVSQTQARRHVMVNIQAVIIVPGLARDAAVMALVPDAARKAPVVILAITSVGLHVPHAAATNGIARVIIIGTTYRPVITQQAAHQRPEPARHNVPPAHTVQTAKKTTATVAIHPPPVRPPEHNAIVHAASPAPNRHVRQTRRARTAPRQHRARNIMGAHAMRRHQLVPLQ